MTAIKKVPAIRFKDFEEEWDQLFLGDAVDFYTGLTYSPKNVRENSGTFVLRSSNVKHGEVVDADNVYVDADVVNCTNVRVGDIIVVVRNGSRTLIGKHAQIKREMANTVIGAFMTGIRYEYSSFINALLDSPKFYKEIEKNLGATINQITTGSFKKMEFGFPNPAEQTQIGNYFKQLDNLIHLQEQKLEMVTNLKKAMLERMFPKEGLEVPEIRFKEFDENWQKKKLSDCLETSTQKNQEMLFSKNDVLSVSGEAGIVNQIEFQGRSFAGISVSNYGIVKHGNVVYTKSPLKVNPYGIIKTNRGKDGIVSTLYAIYDAKKNIDPNFVEYYFALNKRLNKYLKPLVSKGAKNDMKVSDENALKGLVIFPEEKKEQQKIAHYFEKLDQLIGQYRSQITQLKHLKQALLQKMFI